MALSQPQHPRNDDRQRTASRPLPDAAIEPATGSGEARWIATLMKRMSESADRAAFKAFFEILAPKVKNYMKRLGANDAVAEDLAQDVMVTVWRRAGGFDPDRSANPACASVMTWVYTIARNRRIDWLRRDHHAVLDPVAVTDLASAAPQADQMPQTAEQAQRLRQAITKLPAEQATLVLLAFYSDKTHIQIAAEQGLPLGTVKSRVRLALDRLRRTMADDGDSD